MSGNLIDLETASIAPELTGPVVGIGASAGGLEALKSLFSNVSENCGMSFVVVQHLAPDHPSALADILSSVTKMPVRQVSEAVRIAVNEIYVVSPNSTLTIANGVLTPAPAGTGGLTRPIDHFLRSLAFALQDNAVGIILSGAGNDGTMGLQAIRKFGGLTIAQSPETSRFDSMPRSAIVAGVADHCLAAEEMGEHLISYFAFRAQNANGKGGEDEVVAALPAIFRILDESLGHDFSRYKQSTLIRRIRRRMQMLRIDPVTAYSDVLGKDPREAEQLFKDLIIGVTEFFRDEEMFELLERTVLPKTFQQLDPNGTLRVWVAGCATGEEAYSLAILIKEYMSRSGQAHPIQIFATDIDSEAIDFARQGIYKEEIREKVSADRLARYFQKCEGGFQVQKEIREMCIFSVHNLIHDPPFSRIHLVSCRNVLIYFDAALQQRVLPLLHYSLSNGGYLVLGPAESLGAHAELFLPVEKRLRVFQVKPSASIPAVRLPRPDGGRSNRIVADTSYKVKLARERDAREIHERALLEWYVPPSVLIDGQGEVLHFVKHTAQYLRPPVGSPSFNIFDIVRDDLRVTLRAALSQAKKDDREVVKRDVPISDGARTMRISLIVRPVTGTDGSPERYLVVFQDEPGVPAIPAAQATDAKAEEFEAVTQLEKELRLAKQWLQTTVEELENSNEELKSSNEELISINEEYQSANEALQTSKEELQSLNEELETVNTELSKKVEEFDLANADMQNLFASTSIATIFLDERLRIKRFTPAATQLFSLIDSDHGRSLFDITARFDASEMLAAMQKGVKERIASELEISVAGGEKRYICRITPTPAVGPVAGGAVVNFLDVTKLKSAEDALQDADRRKDQFLALLGHELRNPLAPLKMGLDLLKSNGVSEDDKLETFAMLQRQVTHLTKIVDDLLDVSRISKGLILLRKEPLDLGDLVQDAVSDYRQVFTARNLSLDVAVPAAPLWVNGDRTRLCQIVSNLLHNSGKFTPHGGRISVSLEQDGNHAVITVRDSGCGMDPATIDRLFLPFNQGDVSGDRRGAGLGLGLALVKGLTDLHQGTVHAASPGPGGGSTFVVRLPLTDKRSLQEENPSDTSTKSRRIVIIEDNEDVAKTLAGVLSSRGHQVVVAGTGVEGIDKVEETHADVVICDVGLPGELDGYGVCRKLRGMALDPAPLLIAATGFGQQQDKQRALDAGFDFHFTKPIDVDQVERIFNQSDR